ncbi:hypothetical protein Tco_0392406 [Tanacetum coccineum]
MCLQTVRTHHVIRSRLWQYSRAPGAEDRSSVLSVSHELLWLELGPPAVFNAKFIWYKICSVRLYEYRRGRLSDGDGEFINYCEMLRLDQLSHGTLCNVSKHTLDDDCDREICRDVPEMRYIEYL